MDERHVWGPPAVGKRQRERDALGERDEHARAPTRGGHTLAHVQSEAGFQWSHAPTSEPGAYSSSAPSVTASSR